MNEQELRDAWTRWSEARPERFDWKVAMSVEPEAIDVSFIATRTGYKPGRQEMVVRVHGPAWPPGAPEVEGWVNRPVLMELSTHPDQALKVSDALTAAWERPELLELAENGFPNPLLGFVYERLGWRPQPRRQG